MLKSLLICEGAAVDLARYTVTLHATGCVHRVSEQTVARHPLTHHTGHHGASVDAHSDLHTITFPFQSFQGHGMHIRQGLRDAILSVTLTMARERQKTIISDAEMQPLFF